MSLKADAFVDKVRSWWEVYTFRGSPSFRIASKLKALKLDLKKWNEEEFRNVESRMRKLWKDLNDLDLIADCHPLTNEEILEKDRLCTELEKVTLMEEICWRQNLRHSRFKKEIETLSSSIELQILIEDLTPSTIWWWRVN